MAEGIVFLIIIIAIAVLQIAMIVTFFSMNNNLKTINWNLYLIARKTGAMEGTQTPAPSGYSQLSSQSVHSTQNWQCPNCGTLWSADRTMCTKMVMRNGVKVQCHTPKPLATPQPTSILAEKKCPMCAEMVKYEAKICRFCQYKFE
jgi:RNA polymerase subunit RPABC4/transcription elongation factor Spt4